MMTEQETIEAGNKAATLLASDDFNDLYNLVQADLAKDILATAIEKSMERENLYLTYNGIRTFIERLSGLVIQRENILNERDLDHEEQYRSDV